MIKAYHLATTGEQMIMEKEKEQTYLRMMIMKLSESINIHLEDLEDLEESFVLKINTRY